VVVEQPVDEALILPRNLQTRFLTFGLVALRGGLVLAWLTTRTVVRPVNALIEASQEIASGNNARLYAALQETEEIRAQLLEK
jgi:nitrogen fixation/metabolism regulation signal transduction histidine kinase